MSWPQAHRPHHPAAGSNPHDAATEHAHRPQYQGFGAGEHDRGTRAVLGGKPAGRRNRQTLPDLHHADDLLLPRHRYNRARMLERVYARRSRGARRPPSVLLARLLRRIPITAARARGHDGADRAGHAMRAWLWHWRSRWHASMHRAQLPKPRRDGSRSGAPRRCCCSSTGFTTCCRQKSAMRLPAFATVAFGLVFNVSAFLSENFRAGIASIRPGQWHAGVGPRHVGDPGLPSASSCRKPGRACCRKPRASGSSCSRKHRWSRRWPSPTSPIRRWRLRHENYRTLEVLTALAVSYLVLAYPQAKFCDWLYRRQRSGNDRPPPPRRRRASADPDRGRASPLSERCRGAARRIAGRA